MNEKISEDRNIGAIIEGHFKRSQMTFDNFAMGLKCSKPTILSIFKHKSIGIERLVLVSEMLAFDFIHTFYWKGMDTCPGMNMISGIVESIEHISVSYIFEHDINIGAIIKKHLLDHKIKFTDFADMLDCEINVVNAIFSHKSIDIEQLIKICIVLNYDFINILYYKAKIFNLDENLRTIEKSIESAKADIKKTATRPLRKISDYKI
ncbi:MAG: hypothetical protein LBT24_01315 [Tannerella sp.]|jgi:hypothetical protein|nr:hypothetical protein [Tannerella sp.]